jgi:prepilin-type N-terminal cleavage/methylation domain-containing protein/prepilin-type processing-associated H-X9-DG protein
MEDPRAVRRRSRAFTLIELLVVISVIALLISILLPSLKGAREAGRAAVCLSNQKQIGTAMFMYSAQYQGFIPREGTVPDGAGITEKQRRSRLCWPVAFRPFMDDRIGGDTEPNDFFVHAPYFSDPSRPKDQHRIHYVVNGMPMVMPLVSDPGGSVDYRRRRGPVRLDKLHFLDTTLYLSEFSDDADKAIWTAMQSLGNTDLEQTQLYDIWDAKQVNPATGQSRIGDQRHGKGGNALFFDGHARIVAKQDLWKVDTWDDRDYGVRIETLPPP